jgi:hypothetical protein
MEYMGLRFTAKSEDSELTKLFEEAFAYATRVISCLALESNDGVDPIESAVAGTRDITGFLQTTPIRRMELKRGVYAVHYMFPTLNGAERFIVVALHELSLRVRLARFRSKVSEHDGLRQLNSRPLRSIGRNAKNP